MADSPGFRYACRGRMGSKFEPQLRRNLHTYADVLGHLAGDDFF